MIGFYGQEKLFEVVLPYFLCSESHNFHEPFGCVGELALALVQRGVRAEPQSLIYLSIFLTLPKFLFC
jgi:hypothetical protein